MNETGTESFDFENKTEKLTLVEQEELKRCLEEKFRKDAQ